MTKELEIIGKEKDYKMIETLAVLSFIFAGILAYVAHKNHWKIADFF